MDAIKADTTLTPSYVSSRSANSLISFSRPTRIQANTLESLNRILDELLLLVLASAKSLATDRIKSDGILRVLGGQSGNGSGAGALLAKNAVLEAELELRSYIDGQRKEGGKMPLGLSATSRWDGTETFPVQSAYKVLRIRCQYYSTLGDMEDPSPNNQQDQNIMSSDGRPIATITPGVAIYVTALLEFVAEYILQNVARVIERDNSDEASLNDLIKAIEEDEGTSYVWKRMNIQKELSKQQKRLSTRGKVQKPWQVPLDDELDQAAGAKRNRQSVTPVPSTLPASSSIAHDSLDRADTNGAISPSQSGEGSTTGHSLKRRPSTERWFLGRRRGSFRSSQDLSGSYSTQTAERPQVLVNTDTNSLSAAGAEGDDDFDSLVLSGQTMKVSLTPNRLRSMNADGNDESKRSARKRPGTGSLSLRPQENEERSAKEKRKPVPNDEAAPGRPESRRAAAPPSSYRAVDDEARPLAGVQTPDLPRDEEDTAAAAAAAAVVGGSLHKNDRRKSYSVRDMVDMINGNSQRSYSANSPPSPMTSTATDGVFGTPAMSGRESRMSLASQSSMSEISKKGKRVLNLFGRKSSASSGMPSPNPSVMGTSTDRPERRVSLAPSHDTELSQSTTPAPTQDSTDMSSAVATGSAMAAVVESDGAGDEPSERREGGATPALVGLYEEPRANASNSTLSSVNLHRSSEVPSRKVPWSYNRQQSGGAANGRRASGPLFGTAGRVGSISTSSQGHSNEQATNGLSTAAPMSAPPSAWPQANFSEAGGHSDTHSTGGGHGSRTPIVGVSPTFGRTSPSLRPIGGSSASSRSTDTARLLVHLNQKMRECNSVEECQRLVTQALAMAAAAVHSEHETKGNGGAALVESPLSSHDVPQPSLPEVSQQLQAPPPTPPAETVPLARPIVYRNLALPMAVGYDLNEDDALPLFRRQSSVAAWLLDGEGEESALEKEFSLIDSARPMAIPDGSAVKKAGARALQRQRSTSSVGHDSDFLSADERSAMRSPTDNHRASIIRSAKTNGHVHKPYEVASAATTSNSITPAFVDEQDDGRRISTVSSTFSTYRDAEEDAQAEFVTVS